MPRFSEADMQLRQTKRLIARYGQEITLLREPEWEDDGEGGVIRSEDDAEDKQLPPQKLYFGTSSPVAHVARGVTLQQTIGMGDRLTSSYVLVGMPDADIQKDDYFEIDGDTFKVLYVDPTTAAYQRKGELERVSSAER